MALGQTQEEDVNVMQVKITADQAEYLRSAAPGYCKSPSSRTQWAIEKLRELLAKEHANEAAA